MVWRTALNFLWVFILIASSAVVFRLASGTHEVLKQNREMLKVLRDLLKTKQTKGGDPWLS